tara:strand:- start:521 stop:631 length:111 start_codon:yes stop_codon:yes gene_type:complete
MNGERGNCVECGKEFFTHRTGKHCKRCFCEIWGDKL